LGFYFCGSTLCCWYAYTLCPTLHTNNGVAVCFGIPTKAKIYFFPTYFTGNNFLTVVVLLASGYQSGYNLTAANS
jgi:hypothetical protein